MRNLLSKTENRKFIVNLNIKNFYTKNVFRKHIERLEVKQRI